MRKLLLTLLLTLANISLQAQPLLNPKEESLTENPRGVYRLTTILGKTGEVIAPYEQYKICTDSVLENRIRAFVTYPQSMKLNSFNLHRYA